MLIVCAAMVQVALLGWLASTVVDTSLNCACCQNMMTQGTALFELPMAPLLALLLNLVTGHDCMNKFCSITFHWLLFDLSHGSTA